MLRTQIQNSFTAFGLFCLLITVGCGGSGGNDSSNSTAQQSPSGISTETSDHVVAQDVAQPAEAVQHFLQALKDGDDLLATSMLTTRAQQEMERTEAAIKPPGSPTAEFEVTKVEFIADQDGAEGAHVLSVWSEIEEDGTRGTYEIVWIVRKEDDRWGIAGMATKVFEDRDPLILNFENPVEAQERRLAVDRELARRNQLDTDSLVEQATHLEPETTRTR